MKFSIITVTFNSAKKLQFTIDSLRSQSIKNIEYIVIDGGSTDGTIEIINKNKDIITKWNSEPDQGIYDALNKGILMATGDCIGILHSDDFYSDSNVLLKVEQKILEGISMGTYSDLQYISSKDDNIIIRKWIAGIYNREQLKKGWMPPHPTLFLKREVYQKYGLFDTSYKIAADYEIMMRLLWKYKISLGYIPDVLVQMRIGGKSNTLSNTLLKMKEDYRVIKTYEIGGVNVLLSKNFRKLPQFFKR